MPGAQFGTAHLGLLSTSVDAHSEKTGAGPIYKGGYGFSPLACFLDATNEVLAILLRAGNRAPHNADDHLEVLDLALDQLPVKPKGLDPDNGVAMLVRTDSAGASYKFVDALVERGIEFSIGFDMEKAVRLAILALPKKAWTEAVTADGEIREGAEVAERPTSICRCGQLAPEPSSDEKSPTTGPSSTSLTRSGWRHQVFITNSTDTDVNLPRSAPPWPRPRRGPHPLRQRHRVAQTCLRRLRQQRLLGRS